jgi:hypothetical protein
LDKNVFIKDVNYDSNNVGSWIYRINGIDYYVPNYGYIVVIDSSFADITLKKDNKQYFRIDGRMFVPSEIMSDYDWKYNNANYGEKPIGDIVYEQFKGLFNMDNFERLLKMKKGLSISENVKSLIQKIIECIRKNEPDVKEVKCNQDITEMRKNSSDKCNLSLPVYKVQLKKPSIKIIDILSSISCFYEYLHNRVGTCLFVSEKERLIKAPTKPKRGGLLIWEEKNDTYQWIIYIGKEKAGIKHTIMCKKNDSIQEHTVFMGSLYNYNSCDPIQYKPHSTMRYDEKYIFETYTFNNSS